MAKSDFLYEGKRALVVGGATGMGSAAAQTLVELGAEVIVFDHAEVPFDAAKTVRVDLRNRADIDEALGELGGGVDALFSCAGVADGTPGIMKINFIAHRYIIERLVDSGALGRGSAVCMISSVGGLGWEQHMDRFGDFLSNESYEDMAAWVDSHDGTDNYGFSKQVMNYYVTHEAFQLLQRGIRINAIMPGPTDTPLARANADVWLTFASDYRDACGVETLIPEEMGNVMVFLNSRAARGVNGVTLLVDQGHVSASLTDAFDAPFVKMMAGRT
ncbi:MAG TPA: SDR family oxidoreductase [Acidimicrobiia bacterium]|nr:SDR family oxidoreductase [Acidimicrobiia bacterium]